MNLYTFSLDCHGKQQRRDWKIIIDTSVGKSRGNLYSGKISKSQILFMLKNHGVKDIETLEAPDLRKEDVVSTLRKAKVKVPEAFFKQLAAELELPF